MEPTAPRDDDAATRLKTVYIEIPLPEFERLHARIFELEAELALVKKLLFEHIHLTS